jgi:hypothetical protein
MNTKISRFTTCDVFGNCNKNTTERRNVITIAREKKSLLCVWKWIFRANFLLFAVSHNNTHSTHVALRTKVKKKSIHSIRLCSSSSFPSKRFLWQKYYTTFLQPSSAHFLRFSPIFRIYKSFGSCANIILAQNIFSSMTLCREWELFMVYVKKNPNFIGFTRIIHTPPLRNMNFI